MVMTKATSRTGESGGLSDLMGTVSVSDFFSEPAEGEEAGFETTRPSVGESFSAMMRETVEGGDLFVWLFDSRLECSGASV